MPRKLSPDFQEKVEQLQAMLGSSAEVSLQALESCAGNCEAAAEQLLLSGFCNEEAEAQERAAAEAEAEAEALAQSMLGVQADEDRRLQEVRFTLPARPRTSLWMRWPSSAGGSPEQKKLAAAARE